MMKLKLYTNKYKGELENYLLMFAEEVYGTSRCNVDSFVDGHWAIYMIFDEDDCIGFVSYNILEYYGMQESHLSNDYVYIRKDKRNSKAMLIASIQTGKIIEELGIPLEHYYASEGSERLSRKLKGKKLYTAYAYEQSEVLREFSRLNKLIKIKEK